MAQPALHTPKPYTVLAAALCAAGLLATPAQAQSSCSSDGVPPPTRLVERFINAGCATCWGDAATRATPKDAAVLDWIAPNYQGDDTPLSAAALRDATWRLQALKQPLPAKAATTTKPVAWVDGLQLRVAHGQAVNSYMGASITVTLPVNQAKQASRQGWTTWLALVETIAAGSDGTPVERNLVRNTLQPPWSWLSGQPVNTASSVKFTETRIMSLPASAKPGRLRVIGWVQDSRGRVLVAAQSRCEPEG